MDPSIRTRLSACVLVATVIAAIAFTHASLAAGAPLWITLAAAVPFAALFGLLAMSAMTFALGFVSRPTSPTAHAVTAEPEAGRTRTAVVMPVYNEDPAASLGGFLATYQSLQRAGDAADFDFFVASDTTDPEVWVAEEAAFAAIAEQRETSGLYYRHRRRNVARKSGNIAEFCERHGADYDYFIVLDADSVMTGATIREMVRRMAARPDVGILQTVPAAASGDSLLARTQQFAGAMYGPAHAAGFAAWVGDDGNYYGHNAIIRMAAFIESCGLPELPGEAPLGGEILSHDFVEAALIRRAGWRVVLAPDLGGSFEDSPPTLIDYAQRDQRWCQGNLQHLRLVAAKGLHPVSRMHLAMGALSYLASPLWFVFLLSSATVAMTTGTTSIGASGFALFAVVMALLFGPKVAVVTRRLIDREAARPFGGRIAVVGSALVETLLSALLAPILMIHHSAFVLAALRGHSVRWNAQRRDGAGVAWRAAWASHAAHMNIGLGGALALALFAPSALWWALPVTAPLIASVPICVVMSSTRAGATLRRLRLLLVPTETDVPAVLERQRRITADLGRHVVAAAPDDWFTRAVVDPMLNAMHVAFAEDCTTGDGASAAELARLTELARVGGPSRLRTSEKRALLADADAMRQLHRSAWTEWPTETLERATG